MFQSNQPIEKPEWNELCETIIKVIRLAIGARIDSWCLQEMKKEMTEDRFEKKKLNLKVNWNMSNVLAAAAIITDFYGFADLAKSDRIGWFEDLEGKTNEVEYAGITFPRMDEVTCSQTITPYLCKPTNDSF